LRSLALLARISRPPRTARSSAGSTDSYHFSFTGFTFCGGALEEISLEGDVREFFQIVQTSSGTYHITSEFNELLTGTSASGTQYVGHHQQTYNAELLAAPVFDSTQTVIIGTNVPLISLGSEPKLVFHSVIRTTINADGRVTVELVKGGYSCRG
jgi:hypothetical protein